MDLYLILIIKDISTKIAVLNIILAEKTQPPCKEKIEK